MVSYTPTLPKSIASNPIPPHIPHSHSQNSSHSISTSTPHSLTHSNSTQPTAFSPPIPSTGLQLPAHSSSDSTTTSPSSSPSSSRIVHSPNIRLRPSKLRAQPEKSRWVQRMAGNDIIITGDSIVVVERMKQKLGNKCSIKDLGSLHFFLGIEAVFTSRGLYLKTPMSSDSSLSKVGIPFDDPKLYRQIVGALQYLTLTRPDLSFCVNKVCQFMHAPTSDHWAAVKRILRYLQFTCDDGLLLTKSSMTTVQIFSDSDWAGCIDDCKSTGGYLLYLGNNLISWSSKKQPTVARSSTKSEYKSIANAAAEGAWLCSLLHELRIPISPIPVLWCDNVGAIYLAANAVFHAWTKHVEIDYHFVHDMVSKGLLRLQFLSTKDQIVDILTKSLAARRFWDLRDKLRITTSPSSA
ncbi:hypothetical protein BUALT_Bualt17G0041400 [Buddleja alternifolia]|uniref:Reverse transcriptase Ty1/copia-type domain-containing protein n=1 Tax=Buddleja alternifolia TaxID=168488 RepID=A0AAV6WDQ3_9LAMI|nr:hypothetical protein BUALT_Bualt17G0041400 [Buddleja alternifolia]